MKGGKMWTDIRCPVCGDFWSRELVERGFCARIVDSVCPACANELRGETFEEEEGGEKDA